MDSGAFDLIRRLHLSAVVQPIVRRKVISGLVGQVLEVHPKAESQKVTARLDKLLGGIEREQAARVAVLTDEIQRSRIDTLIFLYLAQLGWGCTVRYWSGAVVAVNSPVSQMRWLGYPTRWRLIKASRRVHQTCPAEAAQYKAALRRWREARARYRATESEERWRWYIAGAGNRRSLAHRSAVALKRRRGVEDYRKSHRYLYSELLPRREERRRERREMREAATLLCQLEEQIFTAMGVPVIFRTLA